MGKNYLIATNSLLEFVANSLPVNARIFVKNVIDTDFNVSIINRIEVLGHESATQMLTDFMDLATTHQVSETVANQTIALRKMKKIKLPDAIIAATALVHGFTERKVGSFQLSTTKAEWAKPLRPLIWGERWPCRITRCW